MPPDPLFIDDDDRYSRLRLIAWWNQERLAQSRVMVVGAGALGNEVLKNLALVGVGTLYVIDFDRVEHSNLTRSVLFRPEDCGRFKADVAAESMRRLNPDSNVISLPVDVMSSVGLGLFRDVDVVVGCLDNREARLWVNRCCWKTSTPWVDGGIQEINGVVKVFVPPHSACYECTMTENDYRLINLRYSCPLLRREDILAGKVPTAPTIASIIGGIQAQEALKLIHGREVSAGEALVFNGVANQFYRTRLPFRQDCLSHEHYGDVVELPLSHEAAAEELFASAAGHLAQGAARLLLDRDLVVALRCEPCNLTHAVVKPVLHVGTNDGRCPQCQRPARPDFEHEVPQGSPLAGEKLRVLGVPAYDIVRVTVGTEARAFLLGADRGRVLPA
jgi:molybdopterin-synthase adenylyltransferase